MEAKNNENIVESNATEKVSNIEINNEFIEEIKSLKAKLEKDKEATEKLSKEKESLEKEKVTLEEARRKDTISRYEEKAKDKNMNIKDCSKLSLESIKVMIEMVDEYKAPILKESAVEEKSTEESKKVKAQFITKELSSNFKVDEKLNDLVLESVPGGQSLFHYY